MKQTIKENLNTLPNLFIVGAPKCATSFLFVQLKEHTDFYFPEIKELNYFSYDHLLKNSYYKDYKVSSLKKYLSLFKGSKDEKYLVDGSVSYFVSPHCAEKIHDFNPKSKIIITVRNPIDRAYSHYLMDKRMGHAQLPLIQYLKNPDKYPFHFEQYVENSLFAKHIAQFVSVFGKENVLIVNSEKISESTQAIADFLKIDHSSLTLKSGEKVNESKTPKNFIARYLLYNRALVTQLKKIIPTSFVKFMNKFLYGKAEKTAIDSQSVELLKELFRDDLFQLEHEYSILLDETKYHSKQ